MPKVGQNMGEQQKIFKMVPQLELSVKKPNVSVVMWVKVSKADMTQCYGVQVGNGGCRAWASDHYARLSK